MTFWIFNIESHKKGTQQQPTSTHSLTDINTVRGQETGYATLNPLGSKHLLDHYTIYQMATLTAALNL